MLIVTPLESARKELLDRGYLIMRAFRSNMHDPLFMFVLLCSVKPHQQSFVELAVILRT